MQHLHADWSTNQLAEFLAGVSSFSDDVEAMRGGIERAAEAFDAELGLILAGGRVLASVGFPSGEVPDDVLSQLSAGSQQLAGLGFFSSLCVEMEEGMSGKLILARAGDDPFNPAESNLLRGMARVLSLTLKMIERQNLLIRLTKIQRSISHRAPLEEVLDAITQGAAGLFSGEVVGVRLIDQDDPGYLELVASNAIPESIIGSIRRTKIGEGAGGRAVMEGRLVVVDNYAAAHGMIETFVEDDLSAAMAAPVRENGKVVGSLTVASYSKGRVYTESEQQILLSFAEHASLALTDSKTLEAMREAQRAKDMFLAMVSHELKTPLTVMMGAFRTLQMRWDKLAPDLRDELLETGFERGRELEGLIARLLQGARAELADIKQEIEVSELLSLAISGFQHSRQIVVASVPNKVIYTDPAAVKEILGILLENAVSHSSSEAEIMVRCVLEESLTISVENEGSFAGDVDLSALFEPFKRGTSAIGPGVGLGLYIAQRVAGSVGGEIRASSSGGRVAFHLKVPVITPPPDSSRDLDAGVVAQDEVDEQIVEHVGLGGV